MNRQKRAQRAKQKRQARIYRNAYKCPDPKPNISVTQRIGLLRMLKRSLSKKW